MRFEINFPGKITCYPECVKTEYMKYKSTKLSAQTFLCELNSKNCYFSLLMKSVIFSFLLILALPLSMKGNDFKEVKRITANESQNESNSWINFVKLFELSEIPEKALTQIACDSKYWLWINEKMVVFEGQLKRGPTPNDTYYDEVDITPYLKLGKNKIAILVWYFGKDGYSHKSSGQAGLVFKNDAIHINSDNTWLSRLNKAFEYTSRDYPNYRLSESNVRFDARKDSFGWISLEDDLRGFG